MNAHTPEPWRTEVLASSLRITKATFADVNDDIPIVGDCRDETRQANAKRIVACVNWCAGWDDHKMARDISPQHMVDAYKRVAKQRDQLAAALRKIADGQVMDVPFTHAQTVLAYQELARSALRKVPA